MGADQPLLTARAVELGAAVRLDIQQLDPAGLRAAVDRVISEPGYWKAIAKIASTFREAVGYPKAVEEIFAFKHLHSSSI
jgi:UDP:flavonoid glycosyltransferase YjiC (YdhE family)